MSTSLRYASVTLAILLVAQLATQHSSAQPARVSVINANDNRAPAGVLQDGVLTVDLVADRGVWFPERDAGPGHDVFAFGEPGKSLSIPGPLLRVPVGTFVSATIRNRFDQALIVHGLHDRPGAAAAVTVAAGGTIRVQFRVDAAGTYLYWGTLRGARMLRDRWGQESQLLGALIVDPAGPVSADHIFVMSVEDDSAATPAERPLRAAAINGLSWPHAPITTLQLGDTVRTRWINGTDRAHPIHLHGFYFRVDARGDVARDTTYSSLQQRLAVTELLNPGQTMTATWAPDRPGNWLMHCHMALHMGPELRRGPKPAAHDMGSHNHALDVMAGLITGWRVQPRGPAAEPARTTSYRKLRLLVQSAPNRFGTQPGIGFALQQADIAPRADSIVIPGPPLILKRGEPVEINVVNRLNEPTSIHWHGIELDSYFDGVSGWSGEGTRIAPHVGARDSFAVRFTPPRAGTFIYHSHFDEERQLASGLYGPLIVLEPNQTFDAETDLIWTLGQHGPASGPAGVRVLNGSTAPHVTLAAGTRYRIRLININPNMPLTFSILAGTTPVRWRALAKDGATLPQHQAVMVAATQRIAVGEVYDYEFVPERPQELQIQVLDVAGAVTIGGRLTIR